MVSGGVGVGVGDVDGVGVGTADGLLGVGVALALTSKRLSMTAFKVSISSGWAIERTIFPAGSMTYTVGMPFVLYEFLRLSPPVKIGHVIPVEFT
jgi:hypothetical protein